MNLRSDSETDNRLQILAQSSGLTPADIDHVHGEAVYDAYDGLAVQLWNRNKTAKVFVATCWPTTVALMNNVDPNLAGIVFAGLTDSAANEKKGYKDNVTGIRSFEPATLCPYWPYLLAQIWPKMTRFAVIVDQDVTHTSMDDQLKAISSVTHPPLPLNPTLFKRIDASWSRRRMELAISSFLDGAAPSTSGLIVTSGTLTATSRIDISDLAYEFKLPAIYPNSMFMNAGGLMSYGPNLYDLYGQAAKALVTPILQNKVQPPEIKKNLAIVTNKTFELFISRSALGRVGLTTADLPKTLTVLDDKGNPTQVAPPTIP